MWLVGKCSHSADIVGDNKGNKLSIQLRQDALS